MGNRVILELRGSDLPFLAEEDEEAVARLSSNNGLPLFWLALLQDGDVEGAWASEVEAAYADPEGESIQPIRLSWSQARANLMAALVAAEMRAPLLAPTLGEWAAALEALAGDGPTQEVRLDVAEFAGFYDDADGFLSELRRAVRVCHRSEPPNLPVPTDDVARDLTGYDNRTDLPFPRSMP